MKYMLEYIIPLQKRPPLKKSPTPRKLSRTRAMIYSEGSSSPVRLPWRYSTNVTCIPASSAKFSVHSGQVWNTASRNQVRSSAGSNSRTAGAGAGVASVGLQRPLSELEHRILFLGWIQFRQEAIHPTPRNPPRPVPKNHVIGIGTGHVIGIGHMIGIIGAGVRETL